MFEGLLITGPCSAESRTQIYETALNLKDVNPNNDFLFRAGIWKPRTRPGGFEGIGVMGLRWLSEVQDKLGIEVITEVAEPEHVKLCLDHGITHFWIGARSTSNPFSIAKIADALKGYNVTVGIKNPISPDLNLWIGAIERIKQADVTDIFAIHRGFYKTEKSEYRNNPEWGVPIELKRKFPHMKVICDPSHITGDAQLIKGVAQVAMDLLFDGLMIESHVRPENALTDSFQQIRPWELKVILDSIVMRKKSTNDESFLSGIHWARKRIDSIDHDMLKLLQKRMDTVAVIGKNKKQENLPIIQPERWNALLKDRLKYGVELGLSEILIKKIFESIHVESLKTQSDINEN